MNELLAYTLTLIQDLERLSRGVGHCSLEHEHS